jgi:hypothetical protein
MDTTHLDTLNHRLDRLEREGRSLRRWGGLVLLGLAAVAVMGQALPGKVPKAFEAEEFVVRDAQGRMRATLGLGPEGSAGLVVYDASGTGRAVVDVGADGTPELGFADRAGITRATLRLLLDGSAGFVINDNAGVARAGVAMVPDGSPLIYLYSKDGTVLWKAP